VIGVSFEAVHDKMTLSWCFLAAISKFRSCIIDDDSSYSFQISHELYLLKANRGPQHHAPVLLTYCNTGISA